MSPDHGAAAERAETAAERADRNFAEVVQELRVAQTGVQVLFAFLLSLPFPLRLQRLLRAHRWRRRKASPVIHREPRTPVAEAEASW